MNDRYDVVILGAGLAGLSLARHLLLDTDKTVLVLDRREEIPGERQKVGESQVQLAGYYFSRVLGLEEHLLDAHYMKYNLRFYWPAPGRDGDGIEDYSQSYIRNFSNIASYQVDRNVLEAEMLRLCSLDPRFGLAAPARQISVERGEGEAPHRISWTGDDGQRTVEAGWVVDASGRARLLSRRWGLTRDNAVRHGAFFWWVDGRVDIDRLTALSRREQRLRRDRKALGHLPSWLATCHFMADGLWFWVIPLQGKTSLGLVFDTEVLRTDDVMSVQKATEWVCEHFPLFARDLPHRNVLGSSGFKSFSYDCTQAISSERWALTGEAGRFSDPLYSPGSDLISFHNTWIVDAIATSDPEERAEKCRMYETASKAVYQAYLPSYEPGYRALGDAEAFSLKYSWELAIYFAAYVFPFVNDLFTSRRFLLSYFRLFTQLGPLNRNLQQVLVAFARWKVESGYRGEQEPVFFDFTRVAALARAEKTFYEVGLDAKEGRHVLQEQVGHLKELARFAVAHVASVVVGDPSLRRRKAFVEALDPATELFHPEAWTRLAERTEGDDEEFPWSFCPDELTVYAGDGEAAGAPAPVETEEAGVVLV